MSPLSHFLFLGQIKNIKKSTQKNHYCCFLLTNHHVGVIWELNLLFGVVFFSVSYGVVFSFLYQVGVQLQNGNIKHPSWQFRHKIVKNPMNIRLQIRHGRVSRKAEKMYKIRNIECSSSKYGLAGRGRSKTGSKNCIQYIDLNFSI